MVAKGRVELSKTMLFETKKLLCAQEEKPQHEE